MSAEFNIDDLVEEATLDGEDFDGDNDVLDGGDPAWEGEIVESDSPTAVISTEELTKEEAQELTENIRSTGEVLYVLVSQAHAGKAHQALGYESFESYVKEEFGMSRSRAYQLIGQANVIKEITDAVPEGTEISISEAAARDLKGMLDKVVPSIASRTENMSPEEASRVVDETIDEFRFDDVGGGDGDDDFDNLSDEDIDALLNQSMMNFDEEFMGDLRDREGFSASSGGPPLGGGGGGGGAGGFGDFDMELPDFDMELPDLDGDFDLDDDDDDSDSADYDIIYEFYNVITTLSTLPDPEKIISNIAEARVQQINESTAKALEWLTEFSEKWEEKQRGEAQDEE